MIPIYSPLKCSYNRAFKAIESGWISSQGTYIKEAEKAISQRFNYSNFILMNNGTTATHCLFLALRHFHPEIKTIYVPNNVYVAVWNCVLMEYEKSALKVLPIFQDLCIPTDEQFLNALEPNSAIVIVHNVGNIIDVDKIKKIRPDIILVEDMCEALFGNYQSGVYVGANPNVLCSSISFFANKSITCGEGGGLATEHAHVAEYIRRIINQGNTSQRYIHDIHAYNYRPTNIQAALLLDQLDCADYICKRKTEIFNRYTEHFKSCKHIILPRSATPAAHWMFILQIKNSPGFDVVSKYCASKNIDIRPFFYPLNVHAHLSDIVYAKDELSTQLSTECFILPSFPELTDEQVDTISDTILEFANKRLHKN